MTTRGIPNPDDIDRIGSVKPIAEGEIKETPETGRPFSSYMEGGPQNPLLQTGKPPQISPFDLAHGQVPTAGPTFNTIQNQVVQAQTTLGDVSNQFNNNPKLKLKQSTKYLLKNKLTAAKGHIASASNKMGAPKIKEETKPGSGPFAKYLAMLTDGQNQLDATQHHLSAIAAKGEQMNPADMLQIQIKLSKAQQELEYSSLILSKAVDDLKMMMNIQL